MTPKETYRRLCEVEPTIPIFSRDWWLDVVCGDLQWDAVVVERAGQVVGAMPYVVRKRFGLTFLTQPPLTHTLGPWLRPLDGKYAKRLSREKDILEELAEGLPDFHHFRQRWHYERTNWLPFYWRGFSQTGRYTYVIDDLMDKDQLWTELQENIRREIRKATNRHGIEVESSEDLKEILELSRCTFARQGVEVPYSDERVMALDEQCVRRDCRRIWIARDGEGRPHAAAYVVWDNLSAYYLMGGGDPELRNSGATSLVMWEAILHAATVSSRFDFEGSMLAPIERFFRSFGARQRLYFEVTKTPSVLLRLWLALTAER